MDLLNSEKTSYAGYKVNQRVVSNVSDIHDGHLIEKGTEFTINRFPDSVRGKRQHFVLGYTDDKKIVRLGIDNICKLVKI